MKNINFRFRITKEFVITVAVVLLLFLVYMDNKTEINNSFKELDTKITTAIEEGPKDRFEKIYAEDNVVVILDKETGVQYLYRKFMNSGGLTVLLDETGKPLLYEEKE